MAKILVTDDAGNVVESLCDGTDEEDEIGELTHNVSQTALVAVLRRALFVARKKDGRDNGGRKTDIGKDLDRTMGWK
jgi:hypothetical protein